MGMAKEIAAVEREREEEAEKVRNGRGRGGTLPEYRTDGEIADRISRKIEAGEMRTYDAEEAEKMLGIG
jgi:hypothetical protein